MTSPATLRVALAQLPVRVGDLAGNRAAIRAAAAWAESVDADVLLTPEMSVTGYPVEDLLAEPGFVDAAARSVDDLAATSGRVVTVAGAPLPTDRLPAAGGARDLGSALDAVVRPLRNAAVVLADGRVQGAHAKTLLPTYSVFDDARHFGAGRRDQALFAVPTPDGPVTVALLVCEDVWDPTLVAEVAAAGAQAVLVTNASPYEVGKPARRLAVLRAAAVAGGVPVAYVNASGGQDEVVFDGGSLVVDADGRLLARAAAFTPDQLVVDLPVAPARPATRDVVGVDRGTVRARRPLAAPTVAPPLDPHDEVWTALVTGVRDYCTRVGLPRVVLGLSGGVDSALAATIAVDALGPDAVRGVGMPGPYSSPGSVDDAAALAANLGIRFDVVPIADAYAERRTALADVVGGPGTGADPVAWENLQARLRGTTLMTIANATGALVCSTGNRSESAVGYTTLYGDTCGTAPNPLGDLLKTDVVGSDGRLVPGVYGLCAWRNARAVASGEVPPIPASTLTKPPSAELAPDQQDSDSLPPYDVLDPLLLAFLEDRRGPDDLVGDLVARGHDRAGATATVRHVLGLVDRSEFKRRQVPLRIKVSRVAFGRDRRMPLATHWRHVPTPVAEPSRSSV
ncbi:NAD+ synthase [Cellulomonas algicola]|uniref:NAD+ synthase n=1 Tax=Cellulomonas algicola TaxID=2071633 RepID=UPI001C3F7615|nr:NAD+ synthase [Cellulomonas algicola]